MSLGTFADRAVSTARVAWPTWGLWWADVDSPEPVEASGRQALDVAGTAFSGTVVAGGVFNGAAGYRLVAGAGGVNKPLKRKAYVNDAGVTLSIVLGDAAREAGETLTGAPATRLGPHYVRRDGETLGDLLQRHCPRGWYADADGTIRIGTRAATTYEGGAPRVRVDPRGAVIDLAVDSLEGLAPGIQVDGSSPSTDLQIDLTPERLTVRVYFGNESTRRLTALGRIVRALTAHLEYAGVWEYRVVTVSGNRFNLQPARIASGMPDLRNVPVRPGVFGLRPTPSTGDAALLGSLVLVCFADREPGRPQVFGFDSLDSPNWIPLLATARPLAHIGDVTPSGPVAPLALPSIVSGA